MCNVYHHENISKKLVTFLFIYLFIYFYVNNTCTFVCSTMNDTICVCFM